MVSVKGAKMKKLSLAMRYNPAVTIVAAWIGAETGVGPSIASGKHREEPEQTYPQLQGKGDKGDAKLPSPKAPACVILSTKIDNEQHYYRKHSKVANSIEKEGFLCCFSGRDFFVVKPINQAEHRPTPPSQQTSAAGCHKMYQHEEHEQIQKRKESSVVFSSSAE